MNSKKMITMIMALTMVFVMVACSDGETGDTAATTQEVVETVDVEESVEEKEEESVEELTSYIVTDALGREVEIPANPERVIALTSAASEALRILEIPQVGKVSAYKIDSEILDLPSIGSTSSLNMETIYELQPDLIIAQARTHTALEESLELSGAAVYYFDSDLSGEISIVDLIPYLGNVLGKEEIGNDYKEYITELAAERAATVADSTDIKTALIIQEGDTISAAINASGYGSMLLLLEIENIIPDDLPGSDSGSFVTYDMEEITAADPDLIFVILSATDEEERAAAIESYKENPLWSGLSAVQNGTFIALPANVNPNLSTTVDMLELTTQAILATAE
ncbi:MAG: ABC transporter substrate-binding protein [Eubacteriales bacterium]